MSEANRDDEADLGLVLNLIDQHIASPDREALRDLLLDWKIIVQAVGEWGLLSREDIRRIGPNRER